MAGAFLAAGNACADVQQALGFDLAAPADGVLELRVAAVNDDVPGFEVGDELIDELVNRRTRLHHEHDAARFLEQGRQISERMRSDHL